MIAESGPRTILTAVLVAALCTACASGKSVPEVTHDGLQLVPHSAMEHAWVKPGEDFSQYSHVRVLDCYVAFKKHWQLNHPTMRTHDMNRIKKDLAELFRKVFTKKLQKGGYPIATEPGNNVLLLRPAIIDLDIVAPDTDPSVRSTTYTTSAGSMALYVELYDSVSNEILARAVDRRAARHIGDVRITSIGTNTNDARRLIEHWVDLLVSKLDEVHGKQSD